jgi:hypothetical protein
MRVGEAVIELMVFHFEWSFVKFAIAISVILFKNPRRLIQLYIANSFTTTLWGRGPFYVTLQLAFKKLQTLSKETNKLQAYNTTTVWN